MGSTAYEGGRYAFRGFDHAVVVDVETTGLDPESDRIIQFSAIKGDIERCARTNKGEFEQFSSLLNPQTKLSTRIREITGRTDEELKGKDTFDQVAQQLRDFIGDLPPIAHNAAFDKSFLNAEFKRAGVKQLRQKSFCTMKRMSEIETKAYGKRQKWQTLDAASEAFDGKTRKGKSHDANEDARMALEIGAMLYRLDNGLDDEEDSPRGNFWLWLWDSPSFS